MFDVANVNEGGRETGPFSLVVDAGRSIRYRLIAVTERADVIGIPEIISGLCWKGCADPRCQVFKEKKARRIFECRNTEEETLQCMVAGLPLYCSSLAQAGGAPSLVYPGVISGETVTPFAESRWREMELFTKMVFAPYGATVNVLAAHTPCKDQGKTFEEMAAALAHVLVIGRERFRSAEGAYVIALLYDLEGKVKRFGDTLRPREGLRDLLDHPLWQVVIIDE